MKCPTSDGALWMATSSPAVSAPAGKVTRATPGATTSPPAGPTVCRASTTAGGKLAGVDPDAVSGVGVDRAGAAMGPRLTSVSVPRKAGWMLCPAPQPSSPGKSPAHSGWPESGVLTGVLSGAASATRSTMAWPVNSMMTR